MRAIGAYQTHTIEVQHWRNIGVDVLMIKHIGLEETLPNVKQRNVVVARNRK